MTQDPYNRTQGEVNKLREKIKSTALERGGVLGGRRCRAHVLTSAHEVDTSVVIVEKEAETRTNREQQKGSPQ